MHTEQGRKGQRSGTPGARMGLVIVLAALAACGGGDEPSAESSTTQDSPFRAYALAHPATTGAPQAAASAPRSSAETDELAQLSRNWAVAAMDGAAWSSQGNALALPPLHFARQWLVATAAHGETLSALQREAALPSSPAVAAGLMQGVRREVSAVDQARFKPAFLRVATAESYPGTFDGLSLLPLTATQLSANGNLRMRVVDQLRWQSTWPQASAARGVWMSPNGKRDVAMVRIQGSVLQHDTSSFRALGLAVPGGAWLIRIAPPSGPALASPALDAALAEVRAAIAQQPASAAGRGELVLPAMVITHIVDRGSLAGMAAAMDPVTADLRGLDAGGTYMTTASASGGLTLSSDGLQLSGTLSTQFEYSVRNVFAPGWAGTSLTGFFYTDPGVPPCPTGALTVTPFHLVLMRPDGSIVFLARAAQFEGTPCL